jgi:hypothetical protein
MRGLSPLNMKSQGKGHKEAEQKWQKGMLEDHKFSSLFNYFTKQFKIKIKLAWKISFVNKIFL